MALALLSSKHICNGTGRRSEQTIGRGLRASADTPGEHCQAVRRSAYPRYTEADGSPDPASVASGLEPPVRAGLLGFKLRLPAGQERASSGGGGPAVCGRRLPLGGGHGLGEVLRPMIAMCMSKASGWGNG